MVLVLVTDLGSRDVNAGSLDALAGGFGLTQSEIAFCKRLLLGETIAEATDRLGITEEPAGRG